MVELRTMRQERYVTDNMGRTAITDPTLIGEEVYFHIFSHNYSVPADGFNFRGRSFKLEPGSKQTIELKREFPAIRVARLTGSGRFRDSQILQSPDIPAFQENRQVTGQDSVQAIPFQGKIFWFWGDTNRLSYPLGLFRTAGATSPMPNEAKSPLWDATSPPLQFTYFTDEKGFSKEMIPMADRPTGVIWIDGLCVVPDSNGKEQLVCHYSWREGLQKELEHGLAIFDPSAEVFVRAKILPLEETWRFPQGHTSIVNLEGTKFLCSGLVAPNVRVPLKLESILDPSQYESFSCTTQQTDSSPLLRNEKGELQWRWQKETPPTQSSDEQRFMRERKLALNEARLSPLPLVWESSSANPRSSKIKSIELHRGTVRWNRFLSKWVLIAGQLGGESSLLGEVWFSMGDSPVGPFTHCEKILTHKNQTFYNVCHHDFLDQDEGKFIYFEGTYTNSFSGNGDQTPLYDYNQILYQLDLEKLSSRFIR